MLDIGAGNGFTADRLSAYDRGVAGLEPALGMIEPSLDIPWIAFDSMADAKHLLTLSFRDAKPKTEIEFRVAVTSTTA